MNGLPGPNRFKAALAEGRGQVGLWQALASSYTAEICATAGFDWLLLDGEHGPNDVPLLLSQLQAIAAYPVEAVARTPSGDPAILKRYLDIGARNILVPFVETPAQAEALVQAVRYAPAGIRGVASGLVRASRWNAVPGYLATADADICLLVQIESIAGLSNIEAIASIEGIDGLFVGPADLSAALGYRGQPGHPDMMAVVRDALARIRRAGKAAGLLTLDEDFARECLAQGCAFVAVATDVGLLAGGTRALAARFGMGTAGSGGY